MQSLVYILFTILWLAQVWVFATSISHHGYVRIMNAYGDTQPQFIPSSYITSLPRWSLTEDMEPKRLVGTASHDPSNRGFVNPTSLDELWWPLDIQQLQVRPVLEILLKKGVPTHVMAGLQVRVPQHISKNGAEWDNYGLHSQPMAHRWTSMNMIYESNFRVEVYLGTKQGTTLETEANVDTFQWVSLEGSKVLGGKNHETWKAVEDLGVFLATLDNNSPLLEGLHILSLPMQNTWSNLPPLMEFPDRTYQLVSIASVETLADELLDKDDSFIDLTGASVLRVTVSQTAAGSSSEYLPDAYRPLYQVKR